MTEGTVQTERTLIAIAVALAILAGPSGALAASGEESQLRISRDLEAGRPVVVHVVVALCDNENQGIIPVPKHLGNGQDPGSNLYWGALYGVRTFLSRHGGWRIVADQRPVDERIHERVVFFDSLRRAGSIVPVYVVADAWDGAEIRGAVETFLRIARGSAVEEISVENGSDSVRISAGGAAHLVGFVGHNGLMDFSLPAPAEAAPRGGASSSLVLACASKPYFLDALDGAGVHPLLLTTGLMAPEAYTLNAVIRSWIEEGSVAAVREAAAEAYRQYQRCSLAAARNLFWGASP